MCGVLASSDAADNVGVVGQGVQAAKGQPDRDSQPMSDLSSLEGGSSANRTPYARRRQPDTTDADSQTPLTQTAGHH